MKIIYVHCGEETNIIDPRSYKQDLKKKFRPVWDLNQVSQRSFECSK